MNFQEMLEKYERGILTATHFSIDVMTLIDDGNVDSILTAIPREVLDRVREFVEGYQPGKMIEIGEVKNPSSERVNCINRGIQRMDFQDGKD